MKCHQLPMNCWSLRNGPLKRRSVILTRLVSDDSVLIKDHQRRTPPIPKSTRPDPRLHAQPAPHLRSRHQPRLLKNRLPLAQHHKIRNRLHPESRGQLRMLLRIHFQNQSLPRSLARQFLQLRRSHPAGPAPIRPEIDQNRNIRRIHDLRKRRIIHLDRFTLRRKRILAGRASPSVCQVSRRNSVALSAACAGPNCRKASHILILPIPAKNPVTAIFCPFTY